ncbi:hypothetical protein protein, putative [Babesia ovis]|uniref:Uncharacterized protein n=1 Tax=Babesia ovis TaxID=5869 RepID=A0A9W5WU87_BABOV|nr:hypothetical protein protein, putative [Babesia ovis]
MLFTISLTDGIPINIFREDDELMIPSFVYSTVQSSSKVAKAALRLDVAVIVLFLVLVDLKELLESNEFLSPGLFSVGILSSVFFSDLLSLVLISLPDGAAHMDPEESPFVTDGTFTNAGTEWLLAGKEAWAQGLMLEFRVTKLGHGPSVVRLRCIPLGIKGSVGNGYIDITVSSTQ